MTFTCTLIYSVDYSNMYPQACLLALEGEHTNIGICIVPCSSDCFCIYAECTVLITPYRELLNSYTCGVMQSVEPYHGRPVLGAMFDPGEPCFFHIVHFQRDVTNLYVYMLKTLGKRLCSDYHVLPMFKRRSRH